MPSAFVQRASVQLVEVLGGFVIALGGCALGGCRSAPETNARPAEISASSTPPGDMPRSAERSDAAAAATSVSTTAPPPAGPKKRYRVAALGDSITDERVGGGGYLRHLREHCPESRFDDFGRGGDMTNQMRARLERDLLPAVRSEGYDTLIVYGGVNDLYSNLTAHRTNDRIETDLSRIYAAAREHRLRVVAITVSPWGGFRRWFTEERGTNTRLLNAWILGEVAAGHVDVAIDSYGPLSCGDPEVLCTDYESRGHDGLHPGPRGHEILGQILLERAFSDCL